MGTAILVIVTLPIASMSTDGSQAFDVTVASTVRVIGFSVKTTQLMNLGYSMSLQVTRVSPTQAHVNIAWHMGSNYIWAGQIDLVEQ